LNVSEVDVLVGAVRDVDPSIDVVQDVVVVRVAGDGLEGFGETQSSPTLVRAVIEAPASRTLARTVRDIVLGASLEVPADIDRVLDELADATQIIGSTGVVVHALSALEHALWDLLGHALSKPVWQLLGETAEAKPGPSAYSTFWAPTPLAFEELVDTARNQGLAGVKIAYTDEGPPGGDEPSYIRSVRTAIGPGIDLMIDLQRRASLDHVLRLVDVYADAGVRWIEEPFRPSRLDLYEQLAARSPVALAAGETATSLDDFESLVASGVGILQPDLGRCGGLRAAQTIARAAAVSGAVAVPHCWSTGLNLAASVHWAFATGNRLVEHRTASSPLPAGMFSGKPELVDGRFAVPTRPGLGVVVDTHVLGTIAP
jgi:L-alanine-DL-glutamate epimerase-like enolase superfamily enzyme